MSEKVGVSVICTAYNHEDYLEETLKSFVQQVTDFKFEVLAHDDASSDRTAEIIRKYEALYPDIIRGIYQTENQHSQNRRVSQDILAPLCRGKYVAFCPGDDRWIDSNKLQKQFDYMESHPECTICTHRAIWSDQETFKCHIFPDQRESRFYSVGDIIEGGRGIGGHHISWNSVFMRRDVFLSVPDELASMAIGDWQIFLYAASCGTFFCMQDIMSEYRFKAQSSTTRKRYMPSTSKDYSQSYRTDFNKKMRKLVMDIDRYFEGKFSEELGVPYRYYNYHICKHDSEFEKIAGPEYASHRLIDEMRRRTKRRLSEREIGDSTVCLTEICGDLPDNKKWQNEETVVTVFCVACNQEAYIQDALRGFVSQETSFKFEVLVCDNASTDATAKIIRTYANRYPEIIKPIFLCENQEVTNHKIIRTHLLPKAKGKYFAWCGGYDFWIDPKKLQKHVEYMQENENCMISFHDLVVCDNSTGSCGIHTKDHTSIKKLMGIDSLFQCTAVAKSDVYELIPEELSADVTWLWQMILYCADKGTVGYIEGAMAATNVRVEGGLTQRVLETQTLRTEENERILKEVNKTRELLHHRYDDMLGERVLYYTYHICKHKNNLEKISGPEYEEFRLIDWARKETKKKVAEIEQKLGKEA